MNTQDSDGHYGIRLDVLTSMLIYFTVYICYTMGAGFEGVGRQPGGGAEGHKESHGTTTNRLSFIYGTYSCKREHDEVKGH